GLVALAGIGLTIYVGLRVTSAVEAAEALLQRQSVLLEEQNRELDAFAGRVAHDLRGPLTTLTLALGNFARGNRPERSRELMERGIGRMGALIDDLLAFSRAAPAGTACDPAAAGDALRDEWTQ